MSNWKEYTGGTYRNWSDGRFTIYQDDRGYSVIESLPPNKQGFVAFSALGTFDTYEEAKARTL
jgi:hypothetical protein